MLRWFVRDLDIRSNLIAATVQEPLSGLILTGSTPRIAGYFNRMLQDERLYAIGLCLDERRAPIATSQFPPEIRCDALETYADAGQRTLRSTRGLLHLAIRPVDSEATPDARLVLVHDMNFVERRSEETRQYLFYFFVALGGCIALITVVIAQLSWRGWVQGLRALLRGEGILRPARFTTAPELRPIAADLRDLIRDLERQYRPLDGSQRIWDQQALRATLRSELHGNDVIAVSNREPYIHLRTAEGIRIQHPASGLVTALEPVMRACSGTWIAHGSGSADRETVDRHDRVAVPPGQPLYQVRRIWLTPEEERGYYGGFANEGLWPLCHIAHVRPTFRTGDFEHYRNVNAKFADAVVAEAKTKDPVVLVQDYHFALLPRMIRERLPDATIITFWHIPWPNPEAFAICPWRIELARRAAREQHPGLSHAVPLQQFPGHRRPAAGGARRPRILHHHLPRPVDDGAPLSDLDRVATRIARHGEEHSRRAARGPRAARVAARAQARRRHRPPRLHEGDHRAAERGGAIARARAAVGRPLHVRPDRGAVARHDRRLSRLRGAGCVRSPRRSTPATRTRNTRRSCCSSSITSPMPSTSTCVPPTSAW